MQHLIRLIKGNKFLSLIIFVGFVVRFVGLIPNIAHTDEAYTIEHSRELFYNIITRLDFDPHAYKYGSLVFYLQSLVNIPFYLVSVILVTFGLAQPPPVSGIPAVDTLAQMTDYFLPLAFLGGRGITAIFGGLSVFLVYVIGKRLFSREVGIVAALLLAVNPVHVRDSRYITADVPFIFFLLLALLVMLNLSRGQWRGYFLSGFLIGVSSTIKFFPLSLLVYPFATLRDPRKGKIWLVKILAGLLAIPVGVFVSVPFLFFSSESRAIYQHDIQRELLWYGTSLTAFFSSLASYIFSFGNTKLLSPTVLIPTQFTEFHSSFLFFKALGPGVSGLSLVGILVSLVRFPKQTLLLLVIPLASFVYSSFYIGAVYERTSLPMLPFLSIFAAVPLVFSHGPIKKIFGEQKAILVYLLLLLAAFYYPVGTTFAASLSCSRPSADTWALEWMGQNIAKDKKIAQVAPISFPTLPYKIQEIRPDTDFFLEELQGAGFEYVFINTGFLSRFTYQFENNFFVVPNILYQNYFVPLALRDYDSRSSRLKKLARHKMCDPSEFLYYEIPQRLGPAKSLLYDFSFTRSEDAHFWEVEELNARGNKVSVSLSSEEGYTKAGVLEYNWENVYYRGPRIMSQRVSVIPSGIYTFEGWAKHSHFLSGMERDVFLRIDFYKEEQANTLLPGDTVALSRRIYGRPEWQKLSISAEAPSGAKFATFSLNVMGTKNRGIVFFDDLKFLGPR